jgi:uncharacterized caspase-like protein
MDPKSTIAIVVGVEKYAAGDNWNLNGPATDALRFTEWLIERQVPAEKILAFISSLKDVSFPNGVEVKRATRQNIDEVIRKTLQARDEELLIFFWGGHGALSEDESRRLFYADATTADKVNLDLNNFRVALRSAYYKKTALRQQILIIDACATYAVKMRWQYDLPTDQLPKAAGVPIQGREQFVFLGTRPGEDALNIDSEGTGIFSRELLKSLVSTNDWPPNWKALRDDLDTRFTTLRAAKRIGQVPTYYWFSDANDSVIEVGMPAASATSDPIFEMSNQLLPFLVDRQPQYQKLEEIIGEHRKLQSKNPLICFFHGNREQCLAEYQKCLEEEYLSKLLRLKGPSIYFKSVIWPGISRLGRDEFKLFLARNIYDRIGISGSESEIVETVPSLEEEIKTLQQKISAQIALLREPLAIAFSLDAQDFSEYPENISSFLDFWPSISFTSQIPCLVFVFVVRYNAQVKARFGFRDLFRRRPEKIELNKLASLGPGHVLPELESVRENNVVEWTGQYDSRIERYYRASTIEVRRKLSGYFEASGGKLPMSKFVEATESLRNNLRTPISQ